MGKNVIKTTEKIDRYSPMPVYQQIANDMIARIAQEEWRIGDKLPSESELSLEYGASRVTIRQALARIDADGLIDKQRGRGVFLKAYRRPQKIELLLPLISIVDRNDVVASEARIVVTTTSNTQVLSRLSITTETPVVYIERLFLKKKKAVGINRAWFPAERLPGVENEGLMDNSITRTLNKYNYEVSSVENYIESIMLDAVTAQLLGAVAPSPALKVSSVHKLDSGESLEYSETIWNGQDTQFHVKISSKK